MNLQTLLNYRPVCLIHQQPMRQHMRPELRSYDLLTRQVEDGLAVWGKNNKPMKGAYFNFDGTFNINKNQPNLIRFLTSPLRIGMMCSQCRSVPFIHDDMHQGQLASVNIGKPRHFYTFFLSFPSNSLTGKFECEGGIEMIIHHSAGKMYHLTGTVGGGTANFNMSRYRKKIRMDRIINDRFGLTVPQFDPSKIQNTDQLMEKIKLYNLFS